MATSDPGQRREREWEREKDREQASNGEESQEERIIVMPLAVADRTCHAQVVARCCGCTAFFPYTAHRSPTNEAYVCCPIRCVTRCPHDSALDLVTSVSRKFVAKNTVMYSLIAQFKAYYKTVRVNKNWRIYSRRILCKVILQSATRPLRVSSHFSIFAQRVYHRDNKTVRANAPQ